MSEEEPIIGEVMYINPKKSVKFGDDVIEPKNKFYHSNTNKDSFNCWEYECKELCDGQKDLEPHERSEDCIDCINDCEEKNIKNLNYRRKKEGKENRDYLNSRPIYDNTTKFKNGIKEIIVFLDNKGYDNSLKKTDLIIALTEYAVKYPDKFIVNVINPVKKLLNDLHTRYSSNKISKTLFSNKSRFKKRIDMLIGNLQESLLQEGDDEYKFNDEEEFQKLLEVTGGKTRRKYIKRKQKKTRKR